MRTVKQTQARQTSSKQNSSDRNESLKRKDECMGKQEEMALPKTLDWTTRGKCKMKKWKPEQTKCSEMCLTYGKSRDKVINREAHEDSIMTNAESDANKRPWKNLTAQRMWDWPEIFVVDDGWQDFRSKTLVDTTQVLEEKMHMVMSEHLIMQTEETLDYPMTETRKEHRSLAFASNNETSGEMSVQLEVLQEMAEVSTVLQKVQQGKLFQVTMFYAVTLILEEGNKYHELNESYGFVNEQQFALHENLNETAMHRRLCHGAVKHDKPVEGNARDETRTMSSSFGKKSKIDFKVGLVEEIILSHRNVWNHWIGNGNSGMDAVSQANDIDETQLSNGHRKQLKKRSWKIEHNWNLIHGKEEGAQLNMNGTPQDDTLWLREFRDNSSVTRMEMCSLKVPTTASRKNGTCNGPATPFKAMGTQYGSFGNLEVFDDLLEPDRNLDEKKLDFCGERSSVTLYKQKRKRNSTALQLLGEYSDVATENDVSESRELIVVQRLSLKHKSISIGCTENNENKRKSFSRGNVENFLYLLMMVIDDSTTSVEHQIECLSKDRLENEISLTYLFHSQSTLMRKCVTEKILAGDILDISGNLHFGC